MSEQENIKTAEKTLMAVNTRTLDQVTDLYTEDYRTDGPGAAGQTLEQSQANVKVYMEAYPDLHFEVTRRIADGDYVVLGWVGTGTNNGPMRTPSGNTIPPTGTKGKIYGSSTYRFKDGKIAQSWTFWDRMEMLDQMGLMPEM